MVEEEEIVSRVRRFHFCEVILLKRNVRRRSVAGKCSEVVEIRIIVMVVIVAVFLIRIDRGRAGGGAEQVEVVDDRADDDQGDKRDQDHTIISALSVNTGS